MSVERLPLTTVWLIFLDNMISKRIYFIGEIMRIDAGFRGYEHQKIRQVDHQQKTKKNGQPTAETIQDKKQIDAVASTKKGVIRNLENGHYKGVADVRLRINFQAELAAIEKQKSSEALRQAAPVLIERVATEFDSLIKNSQLNEKQTAAANELFVQFESVATDTLSDLSDPQNAIERLRANSVDFLDSLSQLFNQEAVITPATEAPELESASEIDVKLLEVQSNSETKPVVTNSGADASNLFAKFSFVVNDLFDNLQLSSKHPSLTEPFSPENNGVAIEKFLAIYRESLTRQN
ncbi:hypothetical protein N9231_04680 [Saprospiraceae bacterium]|nr:hypothetical protein [Saprospiraceae bacterium]